jgi:HSP90 family molecular chaperone
MTKSFHVELDADHFDRLAKPTAPLAGITELIWNALDAEAMHVDVVINRNELDGVESVEVSDDGHGMTQTEAIRDFHRLGGSWKKSATSSKNGSRPLHGKEGAGRFRAFAGG